MILEVPGRVRLANRAGLNLQDGHGASMAKRLTDWLCEYVNVICTGSQLSRCPGPPAACAARPAVRLGPVKAVLLKPVKLLWQQWS